MILDLKIINYILVWLPWYQGTYLIMKLSVYYRVRQQMLDKVSRITRENLSGAITRAFSKQEHEIKRFNEANNEVADIAQMLEKFQFS